MIHDFLFLFKHGCDQNRMVNWWAKSWAFTVLDHTTKKESFNLWYSCGWRIDTCPLIPLMHTYIHMYMCVCIHTSISLARRLRERSRKENLTFIVKEESIYSPSPCKFNLDIQASEKIAFGCLCFSTLPPGLGSLDVSAHSGEEDFNSLDDKLRDVDIYDQGVNIDHTTEHIYIYNRLDVA